MHSVVDVTLEKQHHYLLPLLTIPISHLSYGATAFYSTVKRAFFYCCHILNVDIHVLYIFIYVHIHIYHYSVTAIHDYDAFKKLQKIWFVLLGMQYNLKGKKK